jgi:hypothetical protein
VLEPHATFCGKCGMPVRAGIKKKRSIGEIRQRIKVGKDIRGGQWILGALGVLCLIGACASYLASATDAAMVREMAKNPEFIERMTDAGVSEADLNRAVWEANHLFLLCFLSYGLPGSIFLGLYFWAKQNPLPANVAGLIVYITVVVASFALNPKAMLNPIGWVIRLAIIGSLAAAIQSAAAKRRIDERERARLKAKREAARADAAEDAEEPDEAVESAG